ncbi:PKD domain-containing protein [Janthinobacterium sp.]|uniref:PKD domain-containing protein n=1 Tax=Janthinobacterium sp. TaxID=1871054 RepID=UPI00258DC669|nr:PKD domain-containing protein [Janthinobacterium sp.]MCX7293633.1 PKD domain-containing protein [Janthinobacterium sp.]
MNSRILFCALAFAALSACGGGSNDAADNGGVVAPPVTPPVTVVNTQPVAQAGPAQSVVVGSVVTLDASTSSDANGDALTYKWVMSSKPVTSAAALDSLFAVKPTFTADVVGTYVATLLVSDGKISSELSSVTVTVSVANAPPVAHAGRAMTVVTGMGIMLDGSASSDANGDSLTYQWSLVSKPAGSTAQLLDANSARPYLIADVPGAYEASLVVNDGKAASAPAFVTTTAVVANAPPVANAGVAQNVLKGSTVILDGSASSDANGDALMYYWTLTSRPPMSTATLSSSTLVKPSFIADKAGTYVATLRVDDGKITSIPMNVTITATSTNAAPVANAGVDLHVLSGMDSVTLDGRASSDADGDNLSYKWTFISVPANSMLQPFIGVWDRSQAVSSFWAHVPGTYVVSLVVNDGMVDSAPSTATIIATASSTNGRPMANAGIDQLVEPGTTVRLTGLGSTDAERDVLTYRWQLKSKPFGSKAVLSSLTDARPTFVADMAGDYVATLIVNDGSANSSEDNVTVTATPNLLNLYQVQDNGAGPVETKAGLPYLANATVQKSCSGSCTANFTVDTFKVAAAGMSFMITNVTAVDSTGKVVPAIVGLVSGQVIPAGSSATFSLVSPKTNGATAKLSYKFFVAETGQSFVYNADFTSN